MVKSKEQNEVDEWQERILTEVYQTEKLENLLIEYARKNSSSKEFRRISDWKDMGAKLLDEKLLGDSRRKGWAGIIDVFKNRRGRLFLHSDLVQKLVDIEFVPTHSESIKVVDYLEGKEIIKYNLARYDLRELIFYGPLKNEDNEHGIYVISRPVIPMELAD